MAGAVCEKVSQLAIEILDSFEKLEVVLRLARAPGYVATDAVLRDVGGDTDAMKEAVDALVHDGVLANGAQGVALARDGAWASHVQALVELYEADRNEVVMVMAKAAVERMRSRAARVFSDAFLIRSKKGPSDG